MGENYMNNALICNIEKELFAKVTDEDGSVFKARNIEESNSGEGDGKDDSNQDAEQGKSIRGATQLTMKYLSTLHEKVKPLKSIFRLYEDIDYGLDVKGRLKSNTWRD
ncbi:hypothetical protein Tco_0722607 [Tanacetum coccineum]